MSKDTPKSSRILELYRMFQMGKVVNKQDMADLYGVNARSIQRDLDTIRDFLADQCNQSGLIQDIEYDKKLNGYRLITQEKAYLTEGEMLAICKILIESRAFSKEKVTSLLTRTLNLCVSPRDRERISSYISNELFSYADPAHPSVNTDFLWEVAQAISNMNLIEVSYLRLKDNKVVKRRIEPVGILFSEYYFYLMGVIDDPGKRAQFDKQNDPFPTIYRVDRIRNLKVLNECFDISYKDRFKEGEYKNRVQFMFGGELQTVVFRYLGFSIESVLDRLPMAKVVDKKDGIYTVEAEVFGSGILMWLLSQGSKVEVLSPQSLRDSWLTEVRSIIGRNEELN